MATSFSQEEKIKRGAEDSWQYFRRMMEFVGFTEADGQAIREGALVIEKHIPTIVADFYDHLLRYPTTRVHFLKQDGTIDQEYLQKRMHHLTNFWRRTASGEYDEDYARYVDYVGRAHTSHGADPNIYIAERYVIGQVGFMQNAIGNAIRKELHDYDPELEARATNGWNLLMMVILEMLSRAYEEEHELEGESGYDTLVNREALQQLAVQTYEHGLGLGRLPLQIEVRVGRIEEIPEGERKLIQVGRVSIGVFHHRGGWYAVRNHCLHRGGPVATGALTDDTLTCPWHGYQYNVTNGQLLVDPAVKLDTYRVILKDEEVYLSVPESTLEAETEMLELITQDPGQEIAQAAVQQPAPLEKNEFRTSDLPAGKAKLVFVDGEKVAVYNVNGTFYATSDLCTHQGGPLHEGTLSGSSITCPWHGSCFDVSSGTVCRGPAREPVRMYRVVIEGQVGKVMEG